MQLRVLMPAAACLALLGACGAATTSTTQTVSPTPNVKTVTVRVQDANGTEVATATLTQTQVTAATASPTSTSTPTGSTTSTTGVRVQVKATSLTPGSHGFAIHAVGKCDAPDFLSAGAIFNPSRRAHGFDNPEGPKNGDLPDLAVGSDGTGSMDFVTNLVTLESGQSNSLNSESGTSLIIHDLADDQKSQPEGGAGKRIACGVIYPGSATTPTGTASPTGTARSSNNATTATPTATPSATITGAAN